MSNIYEFYKESNKDHLNDFILNFNDKEFTHKDLIKMADECAKSLIAMGVKENDPVAIWLVNTPELVALFLAISKIGAVAEFIDPRVTPEQIKSEFKSVVDLIFDVYKDFNITDYRCVLSLRDPLDKEKYHPDDEMWNKAENELREVLNELGIKYTEEIGEAAFYGPKLDVNVKPAIGNEITLSTCQLDFCLPAKFNLKYVDKDGVKKTPVVLHRAILGSLDRFMAYILEETKGALPTWLSPVQVNVIPVNNEYHLEYSKEIYELLKQNNIRVELDDREEKLSYRMRESQTKKIPFTLIIGDKEKESNSISYRKFGTNETVTLSKQEFVEMIKSIIKNKEN